VVPQRFGPEPTGRRAHAAVDLCSTKRPCFVGAHGGATGRPGQRWVGNGPGAPPEINGRSPRGVDAHDRCACGSAQRARGNGSYWDLAEVVDLDSAGFRAEIREAVRDVVQHCRGSDGGQP
jgi:hypothetical protein